MRPVRDANTLGDICTPRPGERALSNGFVEDPSQWLRDYLRGRGITQTEAAGRLGYSGRHMQFLTSGRARITVEFAVRFSRVFNVSPSFLLHMQYTHDLHTYLRRMVADSNRDETLQP